LRRCGCRRRLVVDDTDAYIQAGIQGLGLIRVASYLVAPYLLRRCGCRRRLVVDDTDAYIQAGIQGLGLIRVAS
ncbi:hypothetical protein VS875_22200, partial [Salmonella enterica subsp. enterica serovar Paratyphi A]|nr:hypothetical protein [Salmonella enterica subsp. enterica serovar Paratyphi A]